MRSYGLIRHLLRNEDSTRLSPLNLEAQLNMMGMEKPLPQDRPLFLSQDLIELKAN